LNLRELLEKKTKLTAELEGLVSMVMGYSVEEGMVAHSGLQSRLIDFQVNSGKLQGLTVKMNASIPIHTS
jgi:hypothetical protein